MHFLCIRCYTYAMNMSQFLPWIPVAIGFITAIIAVSYSFKIKGSVVGNILQSFGLGIFVGVCALVLEIVPMINHGIQDYFYYAFEIISYLLLAVGVWKIKDIA